MDELFVRVLGPIEVFMDGALRPLEGRRQRALLGLLAVHAGALVSQERLVDGLWGERPPRTAAKSLQNAVVQLRRTLERDRRSPSVLLTEPGGYRLSLGGDGLDAARFERLLAEGTGLLAERRPSDAVRVLEDGLSLWRGPAYAEVAAEGVIANEAARLEELRLFAREELLEAKLQVGRYAEIIPELRARIAEDPLRERLRRLLMVALYRCGRQEDALEVYRAARTDLVERLGIEPSAEFRALERAVLNQDPTLLRQPPPAAVVQLPMPPTAMIGREDELARLEDLLSEPDGRLLTLTGPGGIGKTRLALELARRGAGRFPDGVYFTDLSPLDSPPLVLPAIARTLGVSEAGKTPLSERLKHALEGKAVLLVLDNFEHLLEARADLSLLLGGAGGELMVVVTSRSRLRLYGEHVFKVSPLPVPPPGEEIDVAELSHCDAVALFVARSRASNSAFTLTDDNAAAVAELCVRLEGIPLALELVAARSDAFSPNVLLKRADRPLDLGTGGPVDVPERQQTLRGALDWSYDRLGAVDQELFASLAIFAGPFSEEAAVSICQTQEAHLEGLVEKSLLTRILDDTGTRLRMLEMVRQYAHERLREQTRGGELEQRFINYYQWLAERAEPQLIGETQADWLDHLDSEHDNLRAALRAALRRNPEIALRMAAAIWRFWSVRGYPTEGRTWLTDALERTEHAPPAVRAEALNGAGVLAMDQGDIVAAHRLVMASLEEFESIDEQAGIARATNDLGLIIATEGDSARASQLLERADAAFTELGDPLTAVIRGNLGHLKLQMGEHAEAIALLQSASKELAANGPTRDASAVGHSLGLAHLARGDLTTARVTLQDAARQALAFGNRYTLLACVEALAALAHAEGDRETAVWLVAFVDKGYADLEIEPNTMDQALCGQGLQCARSDAADPAFATAREQGRAMGYEEATSLALQQ